MQEMPIIENAIVTVEDSVGIEIPTQEVEETLDVETMGKKLNNIKKLAKILRSATGKTSQTKKPKFLVLELDEPTSGSFYDVFRVGKDMTFPQDPGSAFNINKISLRGLVLYKSGGNTPLKRNDTVLIETVCGGNSVDIFAFKVIESIGRKVRLVIMS